jgi:hypothetical protein
MDSKEIFGVEWNFVWVRICRNKGDIWDWNN